MVENKTVYLKSAKNILLYLCKYTLIETMKIRWSLINVELDDYYWRGSMISSNVIGDQKIETRKCFNGSSERTDIIVWLKKKMQQRF